jgi:hypothetical protein
LLLPDNSWKRKNTFGFCSKEWGWKFSWFFFILSLGRRTKSKRD